MSTDERLKIVASFALRSIFSRNKASLPISSFDLLARVISTGTPPAGLLPGPEPTPRFRLTDLGKFERILDAFSQEWSEGKITISRDDRNGSGGTGQITVVDVQVGHGYKQAASGNGQVPHGKKRKRVVDEDADSAAGDAEEEEEEKGSDGMLYRQSAPTRLDSLTKELKEVYSLLQRGTARGRLTAEQVSISCIPRHALEMLTCVRPVSFYKLKLRAHMREHHKGRMSQSSSCKCRE